MQGSDDGKGGGHIVSLLGVSPNLTSLEEELVGVVAELLDSAADDSASRTELLMGSWLRGMSTTTWLELLCDVSACSELLCCTGVCSELLCRVSVALDDSGVASSPGAVLLELGWETSEAGGEDVSELVNVLSSLDSGSWKSLGMESPPHAMNVEATVRPSAAVIALFAATESGLASVTFLFSISIATPDI